jgi:hypothetical protein
MFALSYRPYAFGAFSIPRARDIADAHSCGRLIYYCGAEGRPVAAAIFRVLRADSRHKDFCRRMCTIPRGSLFIQHLAALPGYEAEMMPKLFRALRKQVRAPQTWIELHEENRALREQVGEHGFAHVLTKVMASSDIRGMYVHPREANSLPPLHACEIPTLLSIDPEFLSDEELSALKHELLRYLARGNGWGQHYSHYNKRHSWTAFAIRGYLPEDPTFIIKPTEMSKAWKASHPEQLRATCDETVAASHFPATLKVLADIPGRKQRVRFMRLASGNGELGRHADVTDQDAGTSDGCVMRLHIPLVTGRDVAFQGWGIRGTHEEMHFAPGGLYYIDQRKPHRVTNKSPVDRIHLVVDVYASAELRERLTSRYPGKALNPCM